LASRARQSWSKNRKRPHFASLSQANPSPESKKFFFHRTKKSSRICRGFEQLSSYCGWRVITKKTRAKIFSGTILATIRTVTGFEVWRVKIHIKGERFLFLLYVQNKFFWALQNLGGAQKRSGVTSPECPRVCGPGQNRRQKVFHWSPSCLCRGARQSENLYLIHNMNSVCRFCELITIIFRKYP